MYNFFKKHNFTKLHSFFENNRFLLLTICSMLAVIVSFFINFFFNSIHTDTINLDSNWYVKYHGFTYSDVNLSSFKFQDLKKGDVIILKHDLNDFSKFHQSTLSLQTKLSALEVYANRDLLYSFDTDKIDSNTFIGSGYHRVPLPSYMPKNSTLTIINYVHENSAFSSYMPIYLGNGNDLYRNFILNNIGNLILSIFLVLFGVLFFIVTTFLTNSPANFKQLIFISLYSIFVGIWLFCSSKIAQFLFDDFSRTYVLEFFSLFIAPVFLFLSFYFLLDQKYCSKERVRFFILSIANAVFCLLSLLLHITDTIHFSSLLVAFHILSITELIYVYYLIFNLKDVGSRFQKSMQYGLIIFIHFAFADLIRINVLSNVINPSKFALDVSILPIGSTVFIFCLFISYGLLLNNNLGILNENDKLSKLAYNDCLTNIYNRTKCEDIIDNLNNSSQEYIIVSIDLNGLKTINDTKGHTYGDWLISSFADVLNKFFAPYGSVGRMGGDEFIIFLDDVSKLHYTPARLMQKFLYYTRSINTQLTDFQYDFAYGIASSSELPSQEAKVIYDLADARMYEMKERMKQIRRSKPTLVK